MEATYAAHITSDKRAEVMTTEVKVILDFHIWFDDPSQRFYRSNPTAMQLLFEKPLGKGK